MDTLPNGPTLPPKFTILTNLNLRYSKLLSIERKFSCMVNWLLAEYFKSPTPPLLPRKCDFDKLESTLLVSKDASAKVFAFLTKWCFFFEKNFEKYKHIFNTRGRGQSFSQTRTAFPSDVLCKFGWIRSSGSGVEVGSV